MHLWWIWIVCRRTWEGTWERTRQAPYRLSFELVGTTLRASNVIVSSLVVQLNKNAFLVILRVCIALWRMWSGEDKVYRELKGVPRVLRVVYGMDSFKCIVWALIAMCYCVSIFYALNSFYGRLRVRRSLKVRPFGHNRTMFWRVSGERRTVLEKVP